MILYRCTDSRCNSLNVCVDVCTGLITCNDCGLEGKPKKEETHFEESGVTDYRFPSKDYEHN